MALSSTASTEQKYREAPVETAAYLTSSGARHILLLVNTEMNFNNRTLGPIALFSTMATAACGSPDPNALEWAAELPYVIHHEDIKPTLELALDQCLDLIEGNGYAVSYSGLDADPDASSTATTGPCVVTFAKNWDGFAERAKTNMCWHELSHVLQLEGEGRGEMASRLRGRGSDEWLAAAEVVSIAQVAAARKATGDHSEDLAIALASVEIHRSPEIQALGSESWTAFALGILEDYVSGQY